MTIDECLLIFQKLGKLQKNKDPCGKNCYCVKLWKKNK